VIEERARCVRRHVQCSTYHAELVVDYQRERARQVEAAIEASAGYDTEYRQYVDDHPLITFKDWITKR
jgi:hypothetical protein